ncbi:MAG: DUF1549 domain-containing protein [Myxococcota bacterium]|nr:DUF1549 domain-containing protein [Myxococcota bacterium]
MVVAVLLFAGCGEEPAQPHAEAIEAPMPEMDSLRLLSRMSLDLRGTRPSRDEIEQVSADPEALDDVLDALLLDARFGERIRKLYAEIYLTESDSFMVTAEDFGIESTPDFLAALGQEPLRILEHVANTDMPWTEIVVGDWTRANATLAAMFPLDIDEDVEGWVEARYTDARPSAGVLSTSGMWLRYTSTQSNANRGRANAVSRILLCNDYLTRPLEFDRNVDLLDEDAVADAIANTPSCVNCHTSLDPIAGYLFGFWSFQEQSWVEVSTYHPDRELLWETYTGVPPAFYGAPGESLADLGQQIAADARFPSCAVEQVYSLLLQRDVTLADTDALTMHREAFLDSGLTMRSLVRSVVSDARYRAGQTDAEGAVPTKLLSPDLVASSIEDLTGYPWVYSGYEMLRSDTVGVRTLAGGADGVTVIQNTTSPNTTIILVNERLAEAAASHVVDADAARAAAERRLFTAVDFTETPDTGQDAVVEQIQHLQLRVFGRPVAVDSEEVDANLALWKELYAIEGSAPAAWSALLSALLRDPDFLLY